MSLPNELENFSDEDDLIKEWERSMQKKGYAPFPFTRQYTITSIEDEVSPTIITPPATNTNSLNSSINSNKDDDLPVVNVQKVETVEIKATQLDEALASSHVTNRYTKSKRNFKTNEIHSEYTKRRYKHVESKVGQYIASIRADELKRRRAKLQRHSSMPTGCLIDDAKQQQQPKQQHKGYSTTVLNEYTNDYMVMEPDGMTSSAYSNSTNDGGSNSTGGAGTISRHESSDDAVQPADFIDKQTYAQLVEEKEQLAEEKKELEIRLDEKSDECLRHKRNVDQLRFKIMNYEDKLRQYSTSTGNLLESFAYSYSIPELNIESKATATKETQTEDLGIPTVNLKTPRSSLVQNENVLRQRANSSSSNQLLQNNKIKVQMVLPSPAPSANSSTSHSEFTYYERRYAPVPIVNESADSTDVFNENAAQNVEKRTNQRSTKNRRQRRSTSLRQRFVDLFGRCTQCSDPNQSLDDYGPSNGDIHMQTIRSPVPLLN